MSTLYPIKISQVEITEEQVKGAMRILVDNGVAEDEACVVMQALGYALLDTELFPEEC